jgi:riboflavin kinase/FMN adenylyltransferase
MINIMKNLIIRGQVIHGFEKGKKLGFPTTNLHLSEIYPLENYTGVWCSVTYWQGKKIPGVTHIGPVEIFGEQKNRVETHLLNWETDVYGEEMKTELLYKLRETIRFTDEDKLVEQVMEDIARARNYFKLV